MSIVILNYTKIVDKKGRKRLYSLATCDICGLERIVDKYSALKGLYNHIACSNTANPKHAGHKHTEETKKYIGSLKKGNKLTLIQKKAFHDGWKNWVIETNPYPKGENHPYYGEKGSFYGVKGADHPGHRSRRSEQNRKAAGAKRSGEKNWRWNPNLTEEERKKNKEEGRNSIQDVCWRKDIFERDNFTCCITGICGGLLRAHHLASYADNETLRLDLNNGISISDEYHKLFHHLYGYGVNTPAQFEEFIQNILNPYPARAIV